MSEHFTCLSAVFPVILRRQQQCTQVLLHERCNTGYMDGMWDFAGSGHVEAKETAKEALIRESSEEIGIHIALADVDFAHVCHRLDHEHDRTYYDFYFIVRKFQGIPRVMEPNKCAKLSWFAIDNLPDNMISLRKKALKQIQEGCLYSEIVLPKAIR